MASARCIGKSVGQPINSFSVDVNWYQGFFAYLIVSLRAEFYGIL